MAAKKAMANVKEEMAKELETIQDRIQKPAGNKISTRGKQFNIPGQGTVADLECVILNFVSYNAFYAERYDAENPAPPTCAAIGTASHAALTPLKDAPSKEATSCSKCPNNEFGSDGKGKACKNTYLIALVAPDAAEDAPIYTLSVPPTSLRAFDNYVSGLAALGSLPINVQTTVSFDPNSDYVKLLFAAPLGPNPQAAEHWGRKTIAMDMLLAGPDFNREPTTPTKKKRVNKRRAA